MYGQQTAGKSRCPFLPDEHRQPRDTKREGEEVLTLAVADLHMYACIGAALLRFPECIRRSHPVPVPSPTIDFKLRVAHAWLGLQVKKPDDALLSFFGPECQKLENWSSIDV